MVDKKRNTNSRHHFPPCSSDIRETVFDDQAIAGRLDLEEAFSAAAFCVSNGRTGTARLPRQHLSTILYKSQKK